MIANRHRGGIATCTLALAFAACPAEARVEIRTLEPSSNWIMDYADDSCALRRTFGEGSDLVWLELRQFAPGDEFLVTVGSAAFQAQKRVPKSRFDPGGPLRAQPLAAYGDYGTDVRGLSFPDSLRPALRGETPDSLLPWSEEERDARETSATSLYVEESSERGVQLQTGELHKPMTAMRACIDDLLTHWGIDPEVDDHLTSRAKPRNQAVWARPIQSRFPKGLFNVGRTSRVTFRLLVDAEGKPEACRVMRPVTDEAYQETICGILMDRAEFEPAFDAAGSPVKSYYLLNVVYAVM